MHSSVLFHIKSFLRFSLDQGDGVPAEISYFFSSRSTVRARIASPPVRAIIFTA